MKPRTRTNSLPRRASKQLLAFSLAVFVCAAWPATSWACNIKPYPDQFVVDPTLAASLPPPPALALAGVIVQRSEHAPPGSGDCGEIGFLTLRFVRADGAIWPADVGVRLTVERPLLPQPFTFPTYPFLTTEGTLLFAGGDDPSRPIDIPLQAVAVNAGGVESAPIEVQISEPGRTSGCAIGGDAGRSGGACLAYLALCALAFARARCRDRARVIRTTLGSGSNATHDRPPG